MGAAFPAILHLLCYLGCQMRMHAAEIGDSEWMQAQPEGKSSHLTSRELLDLVSKIGRESSSW